MKTPSARFLALILVWPLLGLPAAAQQPGNTELLRHIELGLKARNDNQLERAATHFQTVVRMAPDMAEAHMNLGWVPYKQSSKTRFSH